MPTSLPTGSTPLSPSEQATARGLITAVLHRYASLGREDCDWDALATLFEPSAIYRLADGRELPPTQLQEVVRGQEAPYIRHHITTIDVQFVGEAVAHSEAFFFAATNWKVMDHWGRWRDVFARQADGTWLIRERTIVVEGQDPEGWTAKTYGEEVRVTSKAAGAAS